MIVWKNVIVTNQGLQKCVTTSLALVLVLQGSTVKTATRVRIFKDFASAAFPFDWITTFPTF